jgi:hypothetical protein
MSDSKLPLLDEDVEALLAVERRPHGAPSEARARVIGRIEATLFGGPPGGGGSGAPPADHATAAGPSAPSPLLPRWIPGMPRLAAWLAATFLAGSVVGAAAMARFASPSAPTIVYIDRPAAAAEPPAATKIGESPPTTEAIAPDVASAKALEARAPLPPTGAGSARPPAAAALAEERAVLDVARTALGRGEGQNALLAINEHQRKFPRGALAEEREALGVQALILVNRDGDAIDRAAAFRRHYPGSILAPAVDSVIDPISSQPGGAPPKHP